MSAPRSDENTLASNNSHAAPITPLVRESLSGHSPEVRQRVLDVVQRKSSSK